jgi:hypothetical protein
LGPRQRHMCRGGGYLFLPGFSSLYDAIHGWMTGRTDGSRDEKSFTKNDHAVLVLQPYIYRELSHVPLRASWTKAAGKKRLSLSHTSSS